MTTVYRQKKTIKRSKSQDKVTSENQPFHPIKHSILSGFSILHRDLHDTSGHYKFGQLINE